MNAFDNPLLVSGKTTEYCSKSVSKPSAQSTKQCDVAAMNFAIVESIKKKALDEIAKGNTIGCLIELQLFSGVRISSLLSVKACDINNLGQIYVRESKNSQNRIIASPNTSSFLARCKALNKAPFEGMSRFYVYREYKKLGLSGQVSGNLKSSVTHYCRHLYISQLDSVTDDISETQRLVGHKSENSTKYYVEKGKQKGRS